MTQVPEPSLPPRPGKKRPDYYWNRFLDGNVWKFVYGVDFTESELFRATVHAYVRRQNKQHAPYSPMIMKLHTRKVFNTEDQVWEVYIQAFWPYDKP